MITLDGRKCWLEKARTMQRRTTTSFRVMLTGDILVALVVGFTFENQLLAGEYAWGILWFIAQCLILFLMVARTRQMRALIGYWEAVISGEETYEEQVQEALPKN